MFHEENSWLRRALRELIHLLDVIIARLESEVAATTITLTVRGAPMTISPTTPYPATEGVPFFVEIVVTDNVTGDVDTPDAGSVTAVSSDPGDVVVVDPSETFATVTPSNAINTDQTLTVNATVGGVACGPAGGAVLLYNVSPAVTPPPDATTITLTASATAPTSVTPAEASAAEATTSAEEAGSFRNS